MDSAFTTSLKRRASLLIASVTFVAAAGLTASQMIPKELCEGFLPTNNMKIPVGAKIRSNFMSPTASGGITEIQFNAVMDRIERLYAPVVKQNGGTLKINRKWTDSTVNASAEQMGSTWVLNMYGGLARHTAINIEGMALVACHEMGHHIGGAPKINGWFGQDWATNEGGADYFATLKCLRNYFAEDDNETILASAAIDPLAKSQCSSEFSNHTDQLLCLRNSMAATSVSMLFMDLHKDAAPPSFATPDKAVVTVMDDDHPATQCRMDTYFNGAICHVDKSVGNSKTDYKEGACVQGVDTNGWRPLCWFKP